MTTKQRLLHLGIIIAIGATWFSAAAEFERTDAGSGEFRFMTEPGRLYRIESSTDLTSWRPLRTVAGDGGESVYQVPRSDEGEHFFRAVSLPAGSALTGDYVATAAGDVLIHPINHASFVMQWDGKTIYNDPVGGGGAFAGIPPADLILIGHRHGDHLSTGTIDAIRNAGTQIVVPQDTFDRLTLPQRGIATAIENGASTTIAGLQIEAIPAYNANHPEGRDNGYVVTIGDTRFYMSGDTGATTEMRALTNIDVAFLSMNIPYTMNVDDAASATRDFKPAVIYPYHYRNQDGSFADLDRFRQLVGDEFGIEVRARKWY